MSNKAQVDAIEVTPQEKGVTLQDDRLAGLKGDLQAHQYKSKLDNLSTWESIKVFRKTVLICSLAGFTACLDGYQNHQCGSIIANKGFIKHFAQGKKALDPTWVSTFNGLFNAGLVIGQFSMQWVSDWIGRKYTILCIFVILLVSITIELTANVWYVWTIAKVIAGIGVGSIQATLPVYISEQSPPQIRGFLIVAYSWWWNLGAVLDAITLEVIATHTPLEYKHAIVTQYGLSALGFAIFVFLPESPWWAVKKGKIDLARRVLTNKYKGVPDYDVERELGIIEATIDKQAQWAREAKAEGPFAILQGLNLKRFLIGSWPKVMQQFVGLAVFSSTSSYFFQIAGFSNAFLASLIISISSLGAVVLDAIFVDKIGRRPMTLIGFGGACFGVTLIAIIGCVDYTTKALGGVLVFGGVTANFFNTFEASTGFAYLTELPEQRFRARATGWGLAWCNLWAILINFTLPLMLAKWSVRASFFFVALGIPGTIVAYFIMPETMRRSPAEIQEMFVDRVPLRRWKGYKTSVERDLEAREAVQEI